MPYAAGRVIHDADSHVMETADWLDPYISEAIRPRLKPRDAGAAEAADRAIEKARARARDEAADAAASQDVIAGAKGWLAYGAFDVKERIRALDQLGFASQLVFPTASLAGFRESKDLEVLYAGTRAHNEAMAAFCRADPRLIAVAYLPLDDAARALIELDAALAMGCGAIWVPATPAGDRSPGHPDLDPIWARLQAERIPFVLHIGTHRALQKAYENNGQPRQTDIHGGGESLRFKDFIVLPHPAQMFLSALLHDGVFDRFPDLRGGVIEFGAAWVPGFLRQLDYGYRSFLKTDTQVQALKMQPSEYIRRHVKFTPFPGEDVGKLIADVGVDYFIFSSDYPHPEGGRDPIGKFEQTFAGIDEAAREKFYRTNFEEMLGVKFPATALA